MDERSYIQPDFKKDSEWTDEQLTNALLKRIGFTEQWSNSLDMFVYQKEDVVVYEAIGGYMYDHTGTILHTFKDLNDAVFEEYGEYLNE